MNVTDRANNATQVKTSNGLSQLEQQSMNGLAADDRRRMQTQMILAQQQQAMSSILNSLNSMKSASVQLSSVMPSSSAGSGGSGFDPSRLSDSQLKSLQGMDPDDQSRLSAQYAMQNEQEQVAFVSNMMKKRNEIAMSVINNLK